MSDLGLNQRLSDFVQAAVTPFHAVAVMARQLEQSGYTRVHEADVWDLKGGARYYTTRNDASIVAWQMPRQKAPADAGFRMIGAHTDSPCLKVKPNPEIQRNGYWQLGVQVYGGVLLNPWFDRDLSLAGRVTYRTQAGGLASDLVNFEHPIATIPNLAIHLDREANSGRKVNPQTMVTPILAIRDEAFNFKSMLRDHMCDRGLDVAQVLDFDLSFYDTQAPSFIGLQREFFASARLDNLLSCFMGLEALVNCDSEQGALLVCNDHEEVGSMSASGAQGPMLEQVLRRICPDQESHVRMLANSMLISADNAHGIHPNFADKHDAGHGPLLGAGPVIKINANQRYATNDLTSGLFRQFAVQAGVEIQAFVMRQDMACGSTIGPITSAELGVKTIDIGVPQFAMHSIRELAASADVASTIKVLDVFLAADAV
ncbi:MAG: M18 family aminopeptidase [Pseudomonadales bacterium]